MSDIVVVGAGVSGVHLALLLQQKGVPVTLISDRTPDQIASGRLPNSVAHHAVTIERERSLGVDHWPADEYGYTCHYHYVGIPDNPLFYRGGFVSPSRAVDYRIYLPRLLQDFTDRGGDLQIDSIEPDGFEALSDKHDLVVVSSGKASTGEFFGVRADKSPYPAPMRRLAVGLWTGVTPRDPHGVTLSLALGHGELIAIPILSKQGPATALLFENIPGGDLEVLASTPAGDDPGAYRRLVLDKLRQHHPTVFEQIVEDDFALTGPDDMLQGAVTPVLRNDFVEFGNGKIALAMGDVHNTVDPVIGQGANSASYSAQVVADTIAESTEFGAAFGRLVADRRRERVEAVNDWTNAMIGLPPADHLPQLLGAMSQSKSLADEFTQNFNDPVAQWKLLSTPESTFEWIGRHAPVAS